VRCSVSKSYTFSETLEILEVVLAARWRLRPEMTLPIDMSYRFPIVARLYSERSAGDSQEADLSRLIVNCNLDKGVYWS
jgi:hypothetical protein